MYRVYEIEIDSISNFVILSFANNFVDSEKKSMLLCVQLQDGRWWWKKIDV